MPAGTSATPASPSGPGMPQGLQVRRPERRERRREEGPDQAPGRGLPDQDHRRRQARAGGRRAAGSRLGRLRALHDRRRRFVQRAIRERAGRTRGAPSSRSTRPTGEGSCGPTHDHHVHSRRPRPPPTTTLDAAVPSRRRGPRRCATAISSSPTVDHDQQRRLRQRREPLGPDRHARARHLRADRRHGDRAPGDRVGARRLVLLRQQDLARDRRRGEHVRAQGLRQRLDQLSPRAARLLGRRCRPPRASRRSQEAMRGRADGRPLPADERGDLRHRRDAHRDRRLVGRRRSPRSTSDSTPAKTRRPRWAAPCRSRAPASSAHRCRRRAEPAVPRHLRQRRAVPWAVEHL